MRNIVILLFASCLAVFAEPAAKPNIVFFLCDDLGWRDVGWHGSRIKTPNLDALARDGLRLEQHYVAPVCSPTRAALMTGRYWSRFGVTTPQNEQALPFGTVTLPAALKAAGYETAITGKWHLGSKPEWGPNLFGFDHAYGSLAGGVEPWEHFYKSGPYERTWHRNGSFVDEQGHVTDLIAAEAARWIESRKDKPFFLYVPFTAPHIPIREPDEWLKPNADIADVARRHHAACVSHMDDGVGRIVKALDRSGRRDGTLIIFSSDNGAYPRATNDDRKYPHGASYPPGPAGGNNEPLRGMKTTLYEGGIRTPAFIHWPAKLKAGEFNAPVHIADWMPTLCAVAGHQPDADLKWDGINVWPLLTGEAKPAERALYWTGPGFRCRALRQGNWKLVVTKGGTATVELFDLTTDPNEQTDLAARQPDRVKALQQRMEAIAAADNTAPVKPTR